VPSSLPGAVVVAAGGRHSLALLADGAVVAWGDNTFGQTAVPEDATNVVAIAAGDFFSLALCADGRLATWGDVSPHDDLVAIAAGAGHRLALRSTGELVAWGRNSHGQATVPDAVSNPAAISAGGDHSLALSADGQILAWGGNYSQQAEPPGAPPGIAAIRAGGAHSLALVGDGSPVISGLPGSLTVRGGRPIGANLTNRFPRVPAQLSGPTPGPFLEPSSNLNTVGHQLLGKKWSTHDRDYRITRFNELTPVARWQTGGIPRGKRTSPLASVAR